MPRKETFFGQTDNMPKILIGRSTNIENYKTRFLIEKRFKHRIENLLHAFHGESGTAPNGIVYGSKKDFSFVAYQLRESILVIEPRHRAVLQKLIDKYKPMLKIRNNRSMMNLHS